MSPARPRENPLTETGDGDQTMALNIKLRARIMCEAPSRDGKSLCCTTAEFVADAESMNLEQFGNAASAYFEENGWTVRRLGGPSELCPAHKRHPVKASKMIRA